MDEKIFAVYQNQTCELTITHPWKHVVGCQ